MRVFRYSPFLLLSRCFSIQFAVDVKVPGNNQSNTEQSSSHPNESDSGTVALIAIAILTTILIIASVVSVINRFV